MEAFVKEPKQHGLISEDEQVHVVQNESFKTLLDSKAAVELPNADVVSAKDFGKPKEAEQEEQKTLENEELQTLHQLPVVESKTLVGPDQQEPILAGGQEGDEDNWVSASSSSDRSCLTESKVEAVLENATPLDENLQQEVEDHDCKDTAMPQGKAGADEPTSTKDAKGSPGGNECNAGLGSDQNKLGVVDDIDSFSS
jgi:hypothetical protein